MNELISKAKGSIFAQLILSYLLFVTGLITNILEFLTLIVWPFNKLLYRKLNYYLSYLFYSNYSALLNWWSGTDVDVFIRPEDFKYFNKENSVVVMNHSYDIDWIMGLVVCQKTGIMAGSKALFKNSLKYLPIFGWHWIFGENIFLKRNWEADSKTIVNKLTSIFEFPKDYFFTVIIFCEGTRFTEEKHKISMEHAQAKGLTVLKHLLLPRTRGFNLLMQLGKNKIDAIYDCTLVIKKKDGRKPNIMTIIKGQPIEAQMLINRIPVKDVPADDEKKCSEFLHKLYERKDQTIEKFVQTGDLSSLGVEKLGVKRNKYDLYLCIMWIILIIPITTYYSLKTLWFGSIYFKLAFVISIVLINILTKLLVRNSVVKTSSSSFGLNRTAAKQKET